MRLEERALAILDSLKSFFVLKDEDYVSLWVSRKYKDAFKVLVATILSQSTTDKAALRAYRTLEAKVGITPRRLSTSRLPAIEKAISFAGLHRTKAMALKRLGSETLKNLRGDLDSVLSLPYERAREELLELPKVGPKTADVLLVTMTGRGAIPVDTHVARVSKRLGLVPEEAKPEAIGSRLRDIFPTARFHDVHLYLIALGREVCKARKPLCPRCPVNSLCLYPHKTSQEELQAT